MKPSHRRFKISVSVDVSEQASHTGMRSYIHMQSSVIGSQAEHTGMRTYYFSADTQEDMNTWLRAMNQATLMQNSSNTLIRTSDKLETFDMLQQQAVPQTNHVTLHQDPDRPVVHEVLLEPIHRASEECCSLHNACLQGAVPGPRLEPPPTLPSSVLHQERPGVHAQPHPGAQWDRSGTYQRAPADSHRLLHRRSTLEQVEQWVKVQKADHKGPPSRENTLPRRTTTDPAQVHHHQTRTRRCQRPPARAPTPARLGESTSTPRTASATSAWPPTRDPTWGPTRARHRVAAVRVAAAATVPHGAPRHRYTPRPPTTHSAPDLHPPCLKHPGLKGPPPLRLGTPTAADIPPPGPPPGSSRTLSPTRRPHTRLGASKSQMLKASTIERRSMPPSGYITHTVSAPSLHGKTPEELTLLLIQLRRHQAKMAAARHHAPFSNTQSDDTYMQLKKDLEYLDLKIRALEPLILAVHSLLLHYTAGPLRPLMNVSCSWRSEGGRENLSKVAESDVDVKLSRLCEQDKILKDLEATISSLKEDKDKLESVLDVSHQQMELYQDQPAHAQKISYQQRLLQEDLVSIRAQISRLSTEMAQAWEEYNRLERVHGAAEDGAAGSHEPQCHPSAGERRNEARAVEDRGRDGGAECQQSQLQDHHRLCPEPREETSAFGVGPLRASLSAEVQPPPRSSVPNARSQTLPHSTVPKWAEDSAPPRPPLPHLYDSEDPPPVVPPLPKEASVIRHMSVRGLKRQSDERKRDREGGQYVANGETDMRSYLSEPELPALSTGADMDYLYFQGK
ncbi:hypothetical protein KUCAC02_035923, partial [Chaenocephalus aceratus]